MTHHISRPARRHAATRSAQEYEPTFYEPLEGRDCLSGDLMFLDTGASLVGRGGRGGSSAPAADFFVTGGRGGMEGPVFQLPVNPADGGSNEAVFGAGASDNGHTVMRLNTFRADPRFSRFTGRNFTSVILDTGISPNSSFFGPDADNNGTPDRIRYQWNFANNSPDAIDRTGHGSNVASAIASSNGTYRGVAPDAGIIALRVFSDTGQGSFTWLEQGLQWVITHAQEYNIASINMSLGDGQNWNARGSMYGIGDELATLAQMGIIVVAAAGNSFFTFGGAMGLAYPAADPNVISVGAVYGQTGGGFSYGSGAQATTSPAGAITPFSQRSPLLDIFAPGAPIVGAGSGTSTISMHGTSQAAPQIAGVALLAQQMATELLGRRLTLAEFRTLLINTGQNIFDGDDENDNAANTNRSYRVVDVAALGNAIWSMRPNAGGSQIANAAPTLTTVTDLTGAVMNRRAIITYNMLAQAANEADPDGDAVTFRVQSVDSGRLTLNGRTVRPGLTTIRPGDSLVWIPAANSTGLQSAFSIVASDGRTVSSSAVPVRINVAAPGTAGSMPRALSIAGQPPAGGAAGGSDEAFDGVDQTALDEQVVTPSLAFLNTEHNVGLRFVGAIERGPLTLKGLLGIETGSTRYFRAA